MPGLVGALSLLQQVSRHYRARAQLAHLVQLVAAALADMSLRSIASGGERLWDQPRPQLRDQLGHAIRLCRAFTVGQPPAAARYAWCCQIYHLAAWRLGRSARQGRVGRACCRAARGTD